MARAIITRRDIAEMAASELRSGSASPPPAKTDYTESLVKMLPAEPVTLWITLTKILTSTDATVPKILPWMLLLIATGGTALYLWRILGVRVIRQVFLTTIGFVVWAFSLGYPFDQLNWYSAVWPALLLPIYTFLAPLLNDPPRKT